MFEFLLVANIQSPSIDCLGAGVFLGSSVVQSGHIMAYSSNVHPVFVGTPWQCARCRLHDRGSTINHNSYTLWCIHKPISDSTAASEVTLTADNNLNVAEIIHTDVN